jgi:hypothetical protein
LSPGESGAEALDNPPPAVSSSQDCATAVLAQKGERNGDRSASVGKSDSPPLNSKICAVPGYRAINIVKDLRGVQACKTSTND